MGNILAWVVVIFGFIVALIVAFILYAVDAFCELLRGGGALDEERWPYTDEDLDDIDLHGFEIEQDVELTDGNTNPT